MPQNRDLVENGYKSVWDFGTSQANGTIKALARTSNYAASNPLINYMGYYSSSSNGSPFHRRKLVSSSI